MFRVKVLVSPLLPTAVTAAPRLRYREFPDRDGPERRAADDLQQAQAVRGVRAHQAGRERPAGQHDAYCHPARALEHLVAGQHEARGGEDDALRPPACRAARHDVHQARRRRASGCSPGCPRRSRRRPRRTPCSAGAGRGSPRRRGPGRTGRPPRRTRRRRRPRRSRPHRSPWPAGPGVATRPACRVCGAAGQFSAGRSPDPRPPELPARLWRRRPAARWAPPARLGLRLGLVVLPAVVLHCFLLLKLLSGSAESATKRCGGLPGLLEATAPWGITRLQGRVITSRTGPSGGGDRRARSDAWPEASWCPSHRCPPPWWRWPSAG